MLSKKPQNPQKLDPLKFSSYTVFASKNTPGGLCNTSRLMVVSHEAKHTCVSSGLCDHYSELFTRMAALKFENAITQSL